MEYQAKTVRLPSELAERLRVTAFMRRTSQATLIVAAVEAHLDRLDAQQDGDPAE